MTNLPLANHNNSSVVETVVKPPQESPELRGPETAVDDATTEPRADRRNLESSNGSRNYLVKPKTHEVPDPDNLESAKPAMENKGTQPSPVQSSFTLSDGSSISIVAGAKDPIYAREGAYLHLSPDQISFSSSNDEYSHCDWDGDSDRSSPSGGKSDADKSSPAQIPLSRCWKAYDGERCTD